MAATLESILTKVRRYNPNADVALLRRAYEYAAEKHKDQKRKTGEPYIIHPIEVVDILCGLEMDTPSLAAGFLHDVIEDCGVSREQLAEVFGDEIAGLVDGVTKLKLADFERRDPQAVAAMEKDGTGTSAAPDPRRKKRMETRSSAENLRKILLAMARDLRVMVIKLGDRLHNMRTLQGLPEDRRKKVAQETMQIFAPLAHRLGIWQVKWQLEDLAFKHLYPDEYKDVTEKIARTRRDREKDIRDAIRSLRDAFAGAGMEPEIQGRPKHLWSIFNKMRKQELDFNDIVRFDGPARNYRHRAGLLRRPRHRAYRVYADSRQVRRLYRQAEIEPVPIHPYQSLRPARRTAGNSNPHVGNAPDGGVWRGGALGIQGKGRSGKSGRGFRPQNVVSAAAAF